MSNLRATGAESATAPKAPQRKAWLIASGVLACAALAMAVVGRDVLFGTGSSSLSPEENRPNELRPARSALAATRSQQPQPHSKQRPASETLVDDDGKALWVSPTQGPPLDLAYLSPGAQIIAVLRPAALLKHPEGEKVRAAFGPGGQAAIALVEQVTGLHLTDMEQLIVGCQAMSDDRWQTTFIVHMTNAIPRETFRAKLTGAPEKKHAGKTYWLANERAYYLPAAGKGKILIVAPTDAIGDIIDLAGSPPPLRRDIERLIGHTDAERHTTIIVAPNSLFSEGQSIFAGELTRLRGPLFWFLGDEFSAAAFSMHWGDNFFLELMATPSLDTSPERAARIFAERVGQIPEKLDAYVASLNAQPYGRQLVARLPAMVRKLASYTRNGFEPDHTLLRCYLPVVAGHNLLMAAELTLAEPSGGATQVAATNGAPTAAAAAGAATAHGGLAKTTSLRFAKDTLEAALEQLSQDIGVPIVIRGPDLQAEGITKNQSFGIDLSNKPAGEILVQILRLANPDKSATAANDSRQKLVYIIEQKPDKTEQIVITTRTRAAERHDELPAAFRSAKL